MQQKTISGTGGEYLTWHLKKGTDLNQDFLIQQENKYGKNIHIHERVEYLAQSREVIFHSQIIKLRFWGLLPAKVTDRKSVLLKIPAEITTKEQVLEYIQASLVYFPNAERIEKAEF